MLISATVGARVSYSEEDRVDEKIGAIDSYYKFNESIKFVLERTNKDLENAEKKIRILKEIIMTRVEKNINDFQQIEKHII